MGRVGLARYLSLCLCLALLGGCATLDWYRAAEQPPLPSPASGHCCWQALQQLQFDVDEDEYQLQAVLLYQREQLTLVLLDQINRRLLTLEHSGTGIQIQTAPGIELPLSARQLLATVYLAYWPDDSWKTALDDNWRIAPSGGERCLSYRQRDLMCAQNAQEQGPQTGETVILRHTNNSLSARITTLQLHPLDKAP